MSNARMKPLEAPFDDSIKTAFDKIMREGMEPLNLFKTKVKHPELFSYSD